MDVPSYKDHTFQSLKKKILPLIQNKIFLGRYTEKRYVESLQSYRDIIVIESSEDIIPNLMKSKEILETYSNKKWIGISRDLQNSESNDCLIWTYVNNVPIGKHWFQLSAIRFESREILLEIQHIQPYRLPDKSILCSDDPDFPKFDINQIFTYENVCEAIKFSAIVFMALFTFAVEAVKFVLKWSIELSYVIVNLVHVCTPICLGMLEFLTKCVGGFYWMVYVIFRGTPSTSAVPAALMNNQRRSINYQRFGAKGYRENTSPTSRFSSPNWKSNQRY
ncbi:uncharacterized protein LOC131673616 [Phymastichus coffea]|uniref:uncharacterized protein LOC131673616 n=1 Tax=Phymastichus coffea TaxID=108790 RepID=UPI00273C7CAA|nr:uncharacterized protein LOC131673616 [Phymastichus coffea]XP_058807715.1 uncharacterized protein LOC131673616 [Phymastichus coffea]XP_058807716.1 uncharacterized protein LOC131673616 [Phymastichus coffea]XP_058807717.1 uncharacterized protein LOC131673616 [Phymastichus coffea]